MRNRILLPVVLVFASIGYCAWGQTAPRVKNDEALQAVVGNYARENVADATIVSLFRKLSDQGDPRATLWLARLYWGGRCGLGEEPGVAEDLAAPVIDQVFKLAEGGDHEAQFLIGACYDEGLGLEFDVRKAVEWYFKAIEGSQMSAYGNLALHFAEGKGVEPDIERARKLMNTGAELGSSFCRELLKEYASPDSKSLARLRELRRSKVVAALGRKTDEAKRMLVDSGIITAPDDFIDFPSGGLSCLEFEDDGIILKSGGDGVVRCIDAYRGMTTSDEARGGIPCGIAWSDGKQDIKDKLGMPYWGGLLSDIGARKYGYPVGNLMFLLAVDVVDKQGLKFWRVREMWHEDFSDEK